MNRMLHTCTTIRALLAKYLIPRYIYGHFGFSPIFPDALDRWNQISRQMYSWSRYAFTALFTLLVVVVMLNLLVSLLNDLYEELKTLAKADWCRAQVGHYTAPLNDTYCTTLLEGG